MKNSDGIHFKYLLAKADGSPVDEDGDYFVLKLNRKDAKHAHACQEAALAYANDIEEVLPQLAEDLREKVKFHRGE